VATSWCSCPNVAKKILPRASSSSSILYYIL
jgi:hypothetical protein